MPVRTVRGPRRLWYHRFRVGTIPETTFAVPTRRRSGFVNGHSRFRLWSLRIAVFLLAGILPVPASAQDPPLPLGHDLARNLELLERLLSQEPVIPGEMTAAKFAGILTDHTMLQEAGPFELAYLRHLQGEISTQGNDPLAAFARYRETLELLAQPPPEQSDAQRNAELPPQPTLNGRLPSDLYAHNLRSLLGLLSAPLKLTANCAFSS